MMPLHRPTPALCALAPTLLALLAGLAPTAALAQAPNPGAATAPDVAPGAPGTYAIIDGKKADIPKIKMGDAATITRIINEGTKNNHVWDQISYISNEIGHRLTGSSNTEKANKWARDQFEKWGLQIPAYAGAEGQKPLGNPKDLRGLWQWNTISARFDRGPCSGKLVTLRNPGSQSPEYRTLRDFEFTAPAWTAGTNGPVRGAVVKMPESDEELAAAKSKIKGAWILVKPARGGRNGVLGGAQVRSGFFAEIRKRWTEGENAEAKAKREADEKAAAEAAKLVTHYEGTMTGGQLPEGGMSFYLDVNLTDPKAVKGTVNTGGFRTADMVNPTYNQATHELKFKTTGPRGDREYTLTLDGDTLKGSTSLPDNGGTITYAGKKSAAESATAKSGPTMEEKVLKLEPAGWILPSNNELVITGGAQGWSTMDVDKVNPDVIVTVRKSDYDAMNSALSDGQGIEAEFDLKHTFTKGPIPVYNTIAEIRGTEKPDEVVIVSGHLDSWNGPGSQGTVDNGTGSAVTIEAARILAAAKVKPKRTIRFILWTGEEQGLLGSVAYVKYLKESNQLDKISAVLVDDGGTNYEGGLACVDNEVDYLAAATAPVNGRFYSETDKKFLDVNVHRQRVFNQVQGSDHNSFMREHVPGFFWDEVGRSDYNHMHHTQHDHLDAAIREYLEQSATCAAVTAYNLACAPDLLPRPSDDEWPGRGGGGGGGNRRGGGAPPAAPAAGDSPKPAEAPAAPK